VEKALAAGLAVWLSGCCPCCHDRPALGLTLDPASWQVLQRCLAHRDSQRTINPHVIVTTGTKAERAPASTAYISHVLDWCGVAPRMLRYTRLADPVTPNLSLPRTGSTPKAS
jgi:hypothetical protein